MQFGNDGSEQTSLVLGEFTDREDLGDSVDLSSAVASSAAISMRRNEVVESQRRRDETYSKLDGKGEVGQISDRSLGGGGTSNVALDVNVRRLDDTGLSLESSLNQSVDKLVTS